MTETGNKEIELKRVPRVGSVFEIKNELDKTRRYIVTNMNNDFLGIGLVWVEDGEEMVGASGTEGYSFFTKEVEHWDLERMVDAMIRGILGRDVTEVDRLRYKKKWMKDLG